jgi:hypothetical protein
MAPRRSQAAAIAAASDGSVLLNVVELLSDDLRARLRKQLGSAPSFIGIALDQTDAAEVIARLDGAAAEASARLLGSRRERAAKRGAGRLKAAAKRR